MRALDKKLLRDLWRMRGQVITITLILASGVASYVCLSGAHRALATSRDAYYAQHAMPDVFVHLERAPDGVAEQLRELPGVAAVQARLVEPVSFRFPGVRCWRHPPCWRDRPPRRSRLGPAAPSGSWCPIPPGAARTSPLGWSRRASRRRSASR